ncbi:MAG TPA: hypothetical protein VJ874_03500 [Candidatus Thermoplasmatota archaeon]|nr:hypothetical protein [Candidatus Thermoplasmatota archaeon]
MIRATLLTLMLAALGLVAFAPSASATCIDSNPDDDGVGTQGCNVPAASFANTCKVLVYGPLPGPLLPTCVPIVCVKECVPHFPPYECVQDCDGETSASATPCDLSVDPDPAGIDVYSQCTSGTCDVGPVVEDGKYDHTVACGPFIQCVTEPCPGSGRIEV